MNRYYSHHHGRDVVDSFAERDLSYPVQSSDSTDVKYVQYSSSQHETTTGSLDSGFSSMTMNSFRQQSVTSDYDPTDQEHVYDMSHSRRGHFVVINNRYFKQETGKSERSGSDVDAANLFAAFKQLGFQVDLKSNLTCHEMLSLAIDYAGKDHTDCDCFAMAVLSHGDDGQVFGTDAVMQIKKLVEPLKRCETLRGKPKLFIVQACRGTEYDEGVDVTDAQVFSRARTVLYRLPKEADFLYAYSTTPGFHAFRHSTKGSPFITAVTKVFREHGDKMEIARLLTRVNREVAFGYESHNPDPVMSHKKQAPSFESMLTKELYFPRKI